MDTATGSLRVSSPKVKISDFFVPVLSSLSSYSFIIMRVSLPIYIDRIAYYLAWFVLIISVLNMLKMIGNLIENN
jgi:hypothetical protein